MTDLLPHLRVRHPELFSSKGLREIACHPGWLDLLDTLCQSLQRHLDTEPTVPKIKVCRVKEKYGGLRFLYDGGDDHCRRLVAEAEALSLVTCEVCGQGASLVGDRWFSVRCMDHLDWAPKVE